MFYLYVNIYFFPPKTAVCSTCFPLKTANVAYLKKNPNYPDFLHIRPN